MKKPKKNPKLTRIKNNAIQLALNKQIPFYLASCITKLQDDSPKNLVLYLMAQSEHLLRLKGYYKKYPKIEQEMSQQIKNDLRAMGYSFD